jgi:hypothetical protein
MMPPVIYCDKHCLLNSLKVKRATERGWSMKLPKHMLQGSAVIEPSNQPAPETEVTQCTYPPKFIP